MVNEYSKPVLVGSILENIMNKINNMNKIKKGISVNIWDDYYEDGYIPDGKIQKTHIYVEDSKMDENDKEKYLKYLLNYINENIKYLDGVKMWLAGDIRVEHMTHKQRERLVDDLVKADLSIDGLKYHIYSES